MEGRLGLAVVVCAAVLLGVTTLAAPPATGQTGIVAQQSSVNADDVRITVTVAEDGTAEWELAFRRVLTDDDETAAFESLQADIDADPTAYADPFAERIRRTVARAENETTREMAVETVSVDTERQSLGREYGIVTYRFTWENFAATSDDELRVGDAIEGLFLDERTRLVIEWPDTYATADVSPLPDERRDDAAVWRGAKTSFVSGEPSVVLRPASTVTTTSGGNGGTGSDGNGDGGATTPSSDGGSMLPLVGFGLLFAVGAVAWRYRDRFGATGDAVDDTPEPTANGGDGAADLLSNEERVLQFVREQGGRVKQQEIVEAFDWTEARTSQIVRDLRDDGSLEGFRLGRENVLKLPDDDS